MEHPSPRDEHSSTRDERISSHYEHASTLHEACPPAPAVHAVLNGPTLHAQELYLLHTAGAYDSASRLNRGTGALRLLAPPCAFPQAYSPYLESTVRMLGSEHTWQGDKEEESTDPYLGR